MKSFLLVITLLLALTTVGQTPNKPTDVTSATRPLVSFTAPAIKLPAERSAQLKQIQEKQDQLARDFQTLEQQKVIIAQRAALELKLTAEQLDQMDLSVDADGYVFKPKPPAKPKTN